MLLGGLLLLINMGGVLLGRLAFVLLDGGIGPFGSDLGPRPVLRCRSLPPGASECGPWLGDGGLGLRSVVEEWA